VLTHPTNHHDAHQNRDEHPSSPQRLTLPSPPSKKRAALALVLFLAALAPAVWGHTRLMEEDTTGWAGSVLAIIMVAAAARIGGTSPRPWTVPPKDPRLATRWWWLVPAALLGALAWWLNLATTVSEPWVVLSWLLAQSCLLPPFLVPEDRRFQASFRTFLLTIRSHLVELLVVALLLAAALAFRLPYLERYPVYVHNDEASCGLMGRELIERAATGDEYWFRWTDHFWNFPSMSFFPSAATQAITGTNLYGHRLSNVLLAMVALVCFTSLVRSLFGPTASLVALALAVSAHTAVHWSRSGIHTGHATWLTVICAWLLWKAVSSGRIQYFILLGFSLASCLLTYNAAFLVPPWIAVILAVYWIVSGKFRAAFTVPLAIAVFSSVLFLAPMIAEFQKSPDSFFQRSSMMVWSDDPSSVAHLRANFGNDFRRAAIARNWERASRLLHTNGDSNLQYGSQRIGMVDGLTAIVFILGLGVALAWPFHPGHWTLMLVLVLNVVLGGLLVMDGVQYSRIAGMALVALIVPALWARQLVATTAVAAGRWAGGIAVAGLAAWVVFVGIENFNYTFVRHDEIHWSNGGMRRLSVETALVRNIRDWGEDNITYLHTSLPTDFRQQGYLLMAEGRTMRTFETADEIDLAPARDFDRVTIVLSPDSADLASTVEERFPGGDWMDVQIEFHDPDDIAMVYRIDSPGSEAIRP